MAGISVEKIHHFTAVLRQRARRNLEAMGLLSVPSQSLNPLESAMDAALSHVRPPADFRQVLGENLSLAAHSRNSGLRVENPRHLREGIILGVSAGLLAALIATFILLMHSRPASPQR